MSKIYYKKANFKYDTSPNVRRPDGKGHVVYQTVTHKGKSKVNVITHSNTFYNQPTYPMAKNPNRKSSDKRQSRFSVPVWESNKHLKPVRGGYWKLDKRDKKLNKKINKKHK